MNKEIRDEWISRLRSGEYVQTRGTLRGTEVGHCCIGVLCEILSDKNLGDWEDGCFDGDDCSLTGRFNTSLGLSIAEETKLITMNDKHGNSFLEIADYIEANL